MAFQHMKLREASTNSLNGLLSFILLSYWKYVLLRFPIEKDKGLFRSFFKSLALTTVKLSKRKITKEQRKRGFQSNSKKSQETGNISSLSGES